MIWPLTLLLVLPLLGIVIIAVMGSARWSRWIAAGSAMASLLWSVQLWRGFDTNGGWQYIERWDWVPSLGVAYSLGVDGMSVLLVVLTTLLSTLAIFSSFRAIEDRQPLYYGLLLVEQAALTGVFCARDFVLFFLAFELTLVPMYFLISLWGGERRRQAALKFFLYTAAGSALLLGAGLLVYAQPGVHTFDMALWQNLTLDPVVQRWAFWLFLVGFAVKVPMFPFHTWLPAAHVQAPTAASVLLAGVLLKMGTYGMARFNLEMFPQVLAQGDAMQVLGVLSIIAILYGALVSLMQDDWKRLIAYSSVSHMGFVTMGLFSGSATAMVGAKLQMINHGISTGMLFLLFGVIYERIHSREISTYGGAAHRMPAYAKVFAFAMFSSIGLPPLNGFAGEFTILQGTFDTHPGWAVLASLALLLGAAYLMWLYQRTMLGVEKPAMEGSTDLTWRERMIFAPLIGWAVWIGVFPSLYFRMLQPVSMLTEALR